MPLHYIETGLMQRQEPQGGPRKYHGAVAQGYDAKRESSPKWQVEQQIVEGMLDGLLEGDWVLDCPVGTGRFIPLLREEEPPGSRARHFFRHASRSHGEGNGQDAVSLRTDACLGHEAGRQEC